MVSIQKGIFSWGGDQLFIAAEKRVFIRAAFGSKRLTTNGKNLGVKNHQRIRAGALPERQ